MAWTIGLISALFALLPQAPAIPFERAGTELLQLADKGRPKSASAPNEIRARLEPLHDRVRLGALEVWVPKRVLTDKYTSKDGPGAKEVLGFVNDSIALQREWVARVSETPADIQRANAALDVLTRWTRELRGERFPEQRGDVLAAREDLERIFFKRVIADAGFAEILLIAPNRAHYIGTIGATSLVDIQQRARLSTDFQRRSMSANLRPGATLIALTTSPEAALNDPFRDEALELDALMENFVHSASHLLASSFLPRATGWWIEGLAICDTIAVRRTDETLCTGHADTYTGSSVSGASGPLGILLWVTRHKSPFRGDPSSQYFTAPLRDGCANDGLRVFDLDTVKPALRVKTPLLGELWKQPQEISNGPLGVKRGFAELYRAYCAGFLHWLDTQPASGERTVLDAMSFELTRYPFESAGQPTPLYAIAFQVTGRELGLSNDADKDLEGAFLSFLQRR